MSNSSGVGGQSPLGPMGPSSSANISPTGGPAGAATPATAGGGNTLNALKNTLIEKYGEADGTKLFNSMIKSIAIMMITQMQQTASNAQQAAKEMNQQTQ